MPLQARHRLPGEGRAAELGLRPGRPGCLQAPQVALGSLPGHAVLAAARPSAQAGDHVPGAPRRGRGSGTRASWPGGGSPRSAEGPGRWAGPGRTPGSAPPGAGAGGWSAFRAGTARWAPGARPPLTPRATGCSSGRGAGTCGHGHRGQRAAQPPPRGPPPPLAAPALTGPRGRSCRPRSPASPAGTGGAGLGAASADPPAEPRPAPATHLRQRQERQQQPQEPAGGRRPREHTGRGRGAQARPPAAI